MSEPTTQNTHPKGIRGWLLFLIIFLVFIRPGLSIAIIIGAKNVALSMDPNIGLDPLYLQLVQDSWRLYFLEVIPLVSAGLTLSFFRKKQTKPIAISLLLIALFAPFIYIFINGLKGNVMALLGPGFFYFVCITYLLRSKRVRSTYVH